MPLDDGEPRGSRAIVALGVAAFWAMGLWLYFGEEVPLLDAILLSVLLAAMPVFALGQAAALERMPFDRLSAYWSSIATLWLIGATSWLVGTRGQAGLEALGIVGLPPLELVGWSVGLAAAGVGIVLGFRVLGSALAVRETAMLERLLPRTRREKGVFSFLSVAAGVGEEIAYRGYALTMLVPLLGAPGAIAASSALFGVLHAYQGALGIVRTALMGGVLALGFVWSGSLLPAMIGHTLIDLVGGLVIADWFLRSEDSARGRARRLDRSESDEG